VSRKKRKAREKEGKRPAGSRDGQKGENHLLRDNKGKKRKCRKLRVVVRCSPMGKDSAGQKKTGDHRTTLEKEKKFTAVAWKKKRRRKKSTCHRKRGRRNDSRLHLEWTTTKTKEKMMNYGRR